MTEPFKTSTFRDGIGIKVMKIEGFSDEEFYDLTHMDYRDMKTEVLRLLDVRNGGLGTTWFRGYGVFAMYTNNSYPNCIFVEMGNNCD